MKIFQPLVIEDSERNRVWTHSHWEYLTNSLISLSRTRDEKYKNLKFQTEWNSIITISEVSRFLSARLFESTFSLWRNVNYGRDDPVSWFRGENFTLRVKITNTSIFYSYTLEESDVWKMRTPTFPWMIVTKTHPMEKNSSGWDKIDVREKYLSVYRFDRPRYWTAEFFFICKITRASFIPPGNIRLGMLHTASVQLVLLVLRALKNDRRFTDTCQTGNNSCHRCDRRGSRANCEIVALRASNIKAVNLS